ncbi:MAG: dienelactone hydrolase family protein [Candidatus Zixiibacteriota bacterium]
MTQLFAPPRDDEIQAALSLWNTRDTRASGVGEMAASFRSIAAKPFLVHIVSHSVAGITHVGAILVPSGALPGTLPLLVLAHDGDDGIDIDRDLSSLLHAFGSSVDHFIYVIPAYRSEALVSDGVVYQSGGAPSPWDYDVDDALALLNAALTTTESADSSSIGVLGIGRGGTVAMLMATRDARIDRVVEFSGLTDFFGPSVQGMVEDYLNGHPSGRPCFQYIDSSLIRSLQKGVMSLADVRAALVQRSPVYFANRLRSLQIQHGVVDSITSVDEAERMIEALDRLGKREPFFEHYFYPSVGHELPELPLAQVRAVDYLTPLVRRDTDVVIQNVNLTRLFAAPRPAEITSALIPWRDRDVTPQQIQHIANDEQTVGGVSLTVSIVSYSVEGVRQYGAIVSPAAAPPQSCPVIVYCHESDRGVDVKGLLSLLPPELTSIVGDFVFVVPSFRSERLTYGDTTYVSEGAPSPWDRDVDDALALLNVALITNPSVDSGKIGVLGFSRGATVGMLMAARDPRIDLVVEFFGVTDFLGSFVRGVATDALNGHMSWLPGFDDLYGALILPLVLGQRSYEDVRAELIRRSPAYFADRLPGLQGHHGLSDPIVPVSEAQRLIQVMYDLGRGEPDVQFFLYPHGIHSPYSLSGSFSRAVEFLERLRSPVSGTAGSHVLSFR